MGEDATDGLCQFDNSLSMRQGSPVGGSPDQPSFDGIGGPNCVMIQNFPNPADISDCFRDDSSKPENWHTMKESTKCGRESPSTVSATSVSFDAPSSSASSSASSLHVRFVDEWWDSDDPHQDTATNTIISSLDYNAIVIQGAFRKYLVSKRRDVAAVKIQACYRGWRCHVLQRIDKLEKRLERLERRKQYSLHWIGEQKKHGMERFKRTLTVSTQMSARRNERDLSRTQQTVDGLRDENKLIRAENKALVESNNSEMLKHKKLRDELLTFQKEQTLLKARLPRLESQNKDAKSSETALKAEIQEYKDTNNRVEEFLHCEKKIKDITKQVILRALDLIKSSCENEELAKTIIEMGMAGIERNEKYEKHLKRKYRNDMQESPEELGLEEVGKTEMHSLDKEGLDLELTGKPDATGHVHSQDDLEVLLLENSDKTKTYNREIVSSNGIVAKQGNHSRSKTQPSKQTGESKVNISEKRPRSPSKKRNSVQKIEKEKDLRSESRSRSPTKVTKPVETKTENNGHTSTRKSCPLKVRMPADKGGRECNPRPANGRRPESRKRCVAKGVKLPTNDRKEREYNRQVSSNQMKRKDPRLSPTKLRKPNEETKGADRAKTRIRYKIQNNVLKRASNSDASDSREERNKAPDHRDKRQRSPAKIRRPMEDGIVVKQPGNPNAETRTKKRLEMKPNPPGLRRPRMSPIKPRPPFVQVDTPTASTPKEKTKMSATTITDKTHKSGKELPCIRRFVAKNKALGRGDFDRMKIDRSKRNY